MATRSLIGINLNDGITKIIYCHWDGYPEHNGQLLVNNYTSPSAVLDLLELGDLSSLNATPDQFSWMREHRVSSLHGVRQHVFL